MLRAGGQLFAETGFAQARVREIARRAGTNLAAINYHFGGKEGLYLAVLQAHAADAVKRHPIPDKATDGGSAEDRLRLAVQSLLNRVLGTDTGNLLPRLLIRELSQPTAALDLLVEGVAGPQIQRMTEVVRDLLGPAVSVDQVRMATFSVAGQCFFYAFARPLVSRVAPKIYDGGMVERLAEHIAAFSLGALRALRRGAERK